MYRAIQRAARMGALGLIVLAAPRAEAVLGGTVATVQTDQAALGASLRIAPTARFTTHELAAPSGTTVREYVSPAGTVFGVAWQGPSMPDLRQLLGPYFDQYIGALETRKTRRSPVRVELPSLVVQSTGRMRAFAGKAYLPQALPQAVSADEIQ